MAILAFLIAAGCTPSFRPHDRTRGNISVESYDLDDNPQCRAAGISRVRTSSGPPRVLLSKSITERRGAPPGSAPVAVSHSDNGRLSTPWREIIFLSTVMDSIFDPSSPALVYRPKLAFH
jgi:hypothetical protein